METKNYLFAGLLIFAVVAIFRCCKSKSKRYVNFKTPESINASEKSGLAIEHKANNEQDCCCGKRIVCV